MSDSDESILMNLDFPDLYDSDSDYSEAPDYVPVTDYLGDWDDDDFDPYTPDDDGQVDEQFRHLLTELWFPDEAAFRPKFWMDKPKTYENLIRAFHDVEILLKALSSFPAGASAARKYKNFLSGPEIFWTFFETRKELDDFLFEVKRMKRCIQDISLELLLSLLPTRFVRKLPIELWNEVLKHIHYDDKTSTNFGIRGQTQTARNLEIVNIIDLFGAIGNIHMILFKVALKSKCIAASIVTTSSTRKFVRKNCVKGIFNWYKKLLEQQFNQLQDTALNHDSCSKIEVIQKGRVAIECYAIKFSPSFVIFPDSISPLVGLISSGVEENEHMRFITVMVCNLETSKTIVTIQIDANTLVGNIKKDEFCLSHDRLVIFHSGSLYQWKFNREKENVILNSDHHMRIPLFDYAQLGLNGTVRIVEVGNETYFIVYVIISGIGSAFHVYEAESGQTRIRSLVFPKIYCVLHDAKGPRLIVKNLTSRKFLFCNILNGNAICNYDISDLCQDANHKQDCNNTFCKFDLDANENQFIMCNPCNEQLCFKLFKYNTQDGEDAIPVISAVGREFFFVHVKMMNYSKLLNGHLYIAHKREIVRHYGEDFYFPDLPYGISFFVLDCDDGSITPICSMIESTLDFNLDVCFEAAFMNEFHRNVCLDPRERYIKKHFGLHFINGNTLCVSSRFKTFPSSKMLNFLKIAFNCRKNISSLMLRPFSDVE